MRHASDAVGWVASVQQQQLTCVKNYTSSSHLSAGLTGWLTERIAVEWGACSGYLVDWDQYGEQMALIGNYVPIMTVPGNHERDCAASFGT
jgi:hypothetical protein